MCRNIKRLRHSDHAPTDAELHDAAQTNQAAFDHAVDDVAAVSRTLFQSLRVRGHTGQHEHGSDALVSRAG